MTPDWYPLGLDMWDFGRMVNAKKWPMGPPLLTCDPDAEWLLGRCEDLALECRLEDEFLAKLRVTSDDALRPLAAVEAKLSTVKPSQEAKLRRIHKVVALKAQQAVEEEDSWRVARQKVAHRVKATCAAYQKAITPVVTQTPFFDIRTHFTVARCHLY